ncbi:MAG: DNA polymerase III subunit alpha, partial [Flavobacteriaceae bacterium]|nr:DNA polymerase III subunit alpha [Flavobacteriaceae bacterium]
VDFANPKDLDGKDVAFGGIISSVEHRIAKNGNGWASFIIEDYQSSHEFRMFGENYLKFKHFLVPNAFLFMRLSGKKNYYDDDIRLFFTEFQLLQDIMEKLGKTVTIHLSIDDINKVNTQVISTLLEKYKGSKPISFTIFDKEENLNLNMISRTQKVTICNELLTSLKDLGLKFKLN